MQRAASLSPAFLWALCRPYRARAALVLALAVLDAALAGLGIGMILPVTGAVLLPEKAAADGAIFDWLQAMPHDRRVLWLAVATALVFAVKAVVSMAHVFLARDLSERMRCYWMQRIGERYLHGAFAQNAARHQGELVNDWVNEPAVAGRFLLACIGYFTALLLTTALLAVGFVVDWRVTLVFVVVGALVAFVLHRSAYGRVTSMGGAKLDHFQTLGAAAVENVGQLREIKLLGLEARRLDEVAKVARRLRRILVRLAVSGEAPRVVGELLAVCIFVGVLAAFVVLGKNVREAVPLLAFFFVGFYRLVTSGMQVVAGRVRALSDLRSVELVHRLSSEPYPAEHRGGDTPIARLETDVRFEDVVFAYGDEPVLRGVTLTIAKGKLTFLVGASGAGKSTVLDLLMRLYSPSGGRIMANGRAIGEFDLAQWRRRLGYVSQDAALFNASIRMNVQLGRPDAPPAAIDEACRLAGAYDFLNDLPAGADTVVGHRGYAISGGQAKRIAIARMLVRQPDLLILDEATSAFEQAMESTIIARIRTRYPQMSVLQITHRLDSARGADHIVILEQGRVAAAGSWNELAAGEHAHFVQPAMTSAGATRSS